MSLNLEFLNNLIHNLRYLVGIGLPFILIASLFVSDKTHKLWAIKGATVAAILLTVGLTFGVGRIECPAFDDQWDNLLISTKAIAAAAPIDTITHRNVVPTPPPPAVSTPEEETSNEGAVPDECTEETTTTEQLDSSMFNLGSGTGVAGVFDDGTPYIIHTVESGETIYGLSRQHGVTENDLLERNDLRPGNSLRIGTRLKIPVVSAPTAPR